MKNKRLCGILLASTFIAGPVLADGHAEAPASSAAAWTGYYAGGFLGGGSYAGTAHDLGGDALDTDGQMVRLDELAGEVGIALGYNVQRGSLVYGAEIDYAATSYSTSETYDDDYRQEAATTGLLTIRGRVGVAVDDTLIYGTAGFGRATITGCISDDELTCEPDDDEILDIEETVNGLVFGAGLEHMLSDTLTVKFEYLQFESDWTDDINYDSGNEFDVARFSADSTVIRVGVNYRF